MINIKTREQCCGCSACESVCPRNAIVMESDFLGFDYPQVDNKKCINCGLCEKVCNFQMLTLKKTEESYLQSHIYACRLSDEYELLKSQSGGAAFAISSYILNKGGIVYGAACDTDFSVHHIRAENFEDCNMLRGSKYVQSRMEDNFRKVRDDLKNTKYVLFTGTGCQVNGLLRYLKILNIDTSKLITCDFICHGVPSPKLWKDYVFYIKNSKIKKEIKKVDFRDKLHYGWNSHKETFYISEDEYYTTTNYAHIFYQHVALRPSCGICPYATMKRYSDFTVCDFWGYKKIIPEIKEDNKGLSMVFVNSEKGKRIFSELQNIIVYRDVSKYDCCLQPNMKHPTVIGKKANNFEIEYKTKGFKFVLHKYGKDSIKVSIINFVRRVMYCILGEKRIFFFKNLLKNYKEK